jgi:predicted metal-dependent phosphoesterase TrpH
VARRVACAALLWATVLAIVSTGRVTGELVLSLAVYWAGVPAVQLAGGALLVLTSSRRTVPVARALDLFLAGHLPWSLWLLAVAAMVWRGPIPFPWTDAVLLSAIVPLVWTAVIVTAFGCAVLRLERGAAIRRAAIHQGLLWVEQRAVPHLADRQLGAAGGGAAMTRPRQAAVALLCCGLATGTLADDRTRAMPPRDEATGEWILAADFHVHAFFGDVGLAPWDLQREARRARLDVLAVTNHGGTFAGRFNRWWASRAGGLVVLPGQEVTSPGYHLIAAGVERAIDPRLPAAGAIRAAQAQGGVAIAAHPVRAYSAGYDAEAIARLDGVEAAHPERHGRAAPELAAFAQRAADRGSPVAFIGSSDFHFIAPLGVTRTFVIAREYSSRGVLDAVRRGQTVAMDRDGALYGPPALAARVRAHRDRSGHGVRPPLSPLAGAAVVAAWLGLLGLVLSDRVQA